jgi:hypothetical protein
MPPSVRAIHAADGARSALTASTPRARRRFSRQRLWVLCLAPCGPHAERHCADHQQDAY